MPFASFNPTKKQDPAEKEEEEDPKKGEEGDQGAKGDQGEEDEEPEVLTGRQKEFRKVREMLRTLSSAMDKPVWDHCTEEDPCVMPNIKRTPDISVVIFPDDYEKNISYPIFIAEVLGKKDPGPQYNQRYEGYNAAMQSLVFAPRCYYFKIGTISPSLYMLQKNPKEGTVTAKKKNYVL